MSRPPAAGCPVIFGVVLDNVEEDWPGRNQLMLSMTAFRPVVFLERRKGRKLVLPKVEALANGALVMRGAFPLVSSSRLRLGMRFASWLDGLFFERALRRAALTPYCRWLETPKPALLAHIHPALVAYDCMDPCLVPDLQDRFDNDERICVARADLVFASAASLERRMRSFGAAVVRLPNAALPADLRSSTSYLEARQALSLGDHPVASYLGTVDSRVDLALLTDVARAMPDWRFVLGGRVNNDRDQETGPLRALTNVEVLGPVDAGMGRQVIAAADVCLIPFVEGPIGDTINPVKMFSYLSFGKRVVATDIEECRDNEHVVTASGTEAFAAAIRLARIPDGRDDVRRHFAMSNTWTVRAACASDLLDRHINGLSGRASSASR